MKTSITFLLLLILPFCISSNLFAQDVVTVKPVHASFIPCAFNFTFANHNASQKNIDGIRFDLVTAISSGGLIQEYFSTPSTWQKKQFEDNPTQELSAASL